jgi:2-succinyl-6-hydroxy-2,4-cyclohexadiene-1-carboxylate synthase
VVAPDLPGHGLSVGPAEGTGLPEAADALVEQLEAIAPTTAWSVAGYSLGGRLALHLAVRHPERVSRLTLFGASAGLEGQHVRAERCAQDAAWAAKLRTRGLPAFLEEWEAQPLFASLAGLSPEARVQLARSREGHDAEALAAALEAFSPGRQPPLHDQLSSLLIPTLWVAGEADAKFTALATELAARMPLGRTAIVPGCGHNVPLERPEACLALITGHPAPQLQGEPA